MRQRRAFNPTHARRGRLDVLGRRLQPRVRQARLPEQRCRPAAPRSASMRGVPDVAFQASAGTGALVYLSLPPDGADGERRARPAGTTSAARRSAARSGRGSSRSPTRSTAAASGFDQPGALQDRREPERVRGGLLRRGRPRDNNNQADPTVPGYPATTGLGSGDRARDAECGEPAAGSRRRGPRQLTDPRSSAR